MWRAFQSVGGVRTRINGERKLRVDGLSIILCLWRPVTSPGRKSLQRRPIQTRAALLLRRVVQRPLNAWPYEFTLGGTHQGEAAGRTYDERNS